MITTNTRIRILKDRLDNPKTSDKERMKIYLFFMSLYFDNKKDIMEWFDELKELTQGYVNGARN